MLSLDITPLLCTTVIDCAVSFQLFDKNNLYFRCIFVKLLTHELNSFDFKGRLEVLSLFWFCLVGHTCSSKFKNVGLKNSDFWIAKGHISWYLYGLKQFKKTTCLLRSTLKSISKIKISFYFVWRKSCQELDCIDVLSVHALQHSFCLQKLKWD